MLTLLLWCERVRMGVGGTAGVHWYLQVKEETGLNIVAMTTRSSHLISHIAMTSYISTDEMNSLLH